jgi:tRNA(Phe) wybutosine-synthesizing methylase Tyw3
VAWEERRRAALQRLFSDIYSGRVDADLISFLESFNARLECAFTSSSCSGRVALMVGKDFLDKRGSSIVWVTHNPLECREAICPVSAKRGKQGHSSLAWISLQPPIMHFHTQDENVAAAIVACARMSGFVRACYRREDGTYFVEVAAHDKLHVVLPAPCRVLQGLCGLLARYKARLSRLLSCLNRVGCGSSNNPGHPIQHGRV